MKTDTVWSPFGTTLPRTYAYSLAYDATAKMLVVGTLGRGVWELPDADKAIGGLSQLWGAPPADQPFTLDVQVTNTGSSHTGSFTFDATAGKFTVSFDANHNTKIEGSETTVPMDLGTDAAGVQQALEALPGIGAGNVLVTKSGSSFSITFQNSRSGETYDRLSADLLVAGVGVTPRVELAAVARAGRRRQGRPPKLRSCLSSSGSSSRSGPSAPSARAARLPVVQTPRAALEVG